MPGLATVRDEATWVACGCGRCGSGAGKESALARCGEAGGVAPAAIGGRQPVHAR